MKYFKNFILFIFLIFNIQIQSGNNMHNEYIPARYVVIAQQIRSDLAEKLSKRHKMDVSGTIGGLANCINILGLSFDILGPLSKEQLRIILVDCVEEFINTINANEELRPHLKNYPFTPHEIEIKLFIVDKNRKDIYDPHISTASAYNGKLSYKTTDPYDDFKFKNKFTETYEEALKIINNKDIK